MKLMLRYMVLVLVTGCMFWMPGRARAMYEILGDSKEALKLKYEVSVRDLDNGRVMVHFAITDEGRLKPVRNLELQIPGREKDQGQGVAPELSLSLATSEVEGVVDGKQTGFELTKELAERAEIWLMARQIDGKEMPLTGYVYRVRVGEYLKVAAPPAAPVVAATQPQVQVTLMGMLMEWQYPDAQFNGAESADAAVKDIAAIKSKAILTTPDSSEKVLAFYCKKLHVDDKGHNLGEKPGERITTERSISIQSILSSDPGSNVYVIAINGKKESTTLVISRSVRDGVTSIAWSSYRQLLP